MVDPFISVIVPVYNAANTLDKCLQSVLKQTYENFEVILINDGSVDSSGYICDCYSQKNEKVRVFHKTNGGVSSARNLGLDKATGEWVTFCDADDWVDSTWLMTYVKNMSNYDLVEQGFSFDRLLNSGTVEHSYMGLQYVGNTKTFLNEMASLGIVGYLWVKCFKKSIIDLNNLRFDTRLNYHEDEEFVLKYLSYCKSVVSVDTPGYNYIMPDFASKYPSVINGYYLYRSLYSRAIEISSGELTNYVCYTLNSMGYYFIVELCQRDFMQRWQFIREERPVIVSNILKSNMPCWMKYAIYFDVTCVFVTLFMNIYISLKRVLHKK